MADTALCFHCGDFKRVFSDKCSSCGFEPSEDLDVAKSRVLGAPWNFTIGVVGDAVETGRSRSELLAISEQIRGGKAYDFPVEELEGVLAAYRQAQATTPGQLMFALLKWLAPPILVALFIGGALWFKS